MNNKYKHFATLAFLNIIILFSCTISYAKSLGIYNSGTKAIHFTAHSFELGQCNNTQCTECMPFERKGILRYTAWNLGPTYQHKILGKNHRKTPHTIQPGQTYHPIQGSISLTTMDKFASNGWRIPRQEQSKKCYAIFLFSQPGKVDSAFITLDKHAHQNYQKPFNNHNLKLVIDN
jgi:hypothetical protein